METVKSPIEISSQRFQFDKVWNKKWNLHENKITSFKKKVKLFIIIVRAILYRNLIQITTKMLSFFLFTLTRGLKYSPHKKEAQQLQTQR